MSGAPKLECGLIAFAVMVATGAEQQALAEAGETASATIVATAEVLAPISLAHDGNASLSFGSIVLGGIGTVDVRVAGGHSTTGNVTLIGTRLPTRDSFSVTGEAGRSFSILTTNGFLGSTGLMSYTTELSSPSGTFDRNGRAGFLVGGILKIEGQQPPGRYTGNYGVTVAYN